MQPPFAGARTATVGQASCSAVQVIAAGAIRADSECEKVRHASGWCFQDGSQTMVQNWLRWVRVQLPPKGGPAARRARMSRPLAVCCALLVTAGPALGEPEDAQRASVAATEQGRDRPLDP